MCRSQQRWFQVDDVAAEEFSGFAGRASAQREMQVPGPHLSFCMFVTGPNPRRDRCDRVTVIGEDEAAAVVGYARNLVPDTVLAASERGHGRLALLPVAVLRAAYVKGQGLSARATSLIWPVNGPGTVNCGARW